MAAEREFIEHGSSLVDAGSARLFRFRFAWTCMLKAVASGGRAATAAAAGAPAAHLHDQNDNADKDNRSDDADDEHFEPPNTL